MLYLRLFFRMALFFALCEAGNTGENLIQRRKEMTVKVEMLEAIDFQANC